MTTKEKIIAALPIQIELVGLAGLRAVYIDGTLLDKTESIAVRPYADGFDWGYDGAKVTQLGLALLCQYMKDRDEETVDFMLELAHYLKTQFLTRLDGGNFKCSVNLQELVRTVANAPTISLTTIFVSGTGMPLGQVIDFSLEFDQVPAYKTIQQYNIKTDHT